MASGKFKRQKHLLQLESFMKQGLSIETFIHGVAVNKSYDASFNIKSVVFGVRPITNTNDCYVLCRCVGGGLNWFIYNKKDLIYGGDNAKIEGMKLYQRMLSINPDFYKM